MTNAESQKSRYKKMKELHNCTDCGGQDERTLAGYTRCSACAEKCRQRAKSRIRSRKRKRKAKMQNLSVYEMARLATAEGLSYGKYVAKCRDERRIEK